MRILGSADDGTFGREVWSFSGPDLAPRLVLDAAPGAAGSGARILGPLADGRIAVGLAGADLWATDGSSLGTRFVARAPGSPLDEEYPPWFAAGPGPLPDGTLLVTLHRILPIGPAGLELRSTWATDGTATGTRELIDRFGEHSVLLSGGRLLLTGSTPSLDEYPYFSLWVTDGTPAGSAVLATVQAWISPPVLLGADAAILSVHDVTGDAGTGWQATGAEPWITDGTPEGTRRLKDINPGPASSSPSGFLAFGDGRALFFADDGVHGREPWITDGTEAGTRLFADIRLGPQGSDGPFGALGIALGDRRLLFPADDGTHGLEFWITDGTEDGTRLFADIHPGGGSSDPAFLAALGGGRFLFLADDGPHGRELWATDGTPAGTRLLADIREGPASSGIWPPNILPLGDGRLLFVADDGVRGREL